MAKFGDLKTPIEIRNHLLDVIDRTLKNDKNACLYHYTDFTSIFNIVCSGYIWLGSTQKMNDLLETYGQEKFTEALRLAEAHRKLSMSYIEGILRNEKQ